MMGFGRRRQAGQSRSVSDVVAVQRELSGVPSSGAATPASGRSQRWFAGSVVIALLVATASAFVITERLKLTPSPIVGTRVSKVFSPVCRCPTARASVRFRLRRGGSVEVDVIDGSGGLVRRLALRRFRRGWLSLSWFGRDQSGRLSADGDYRVRVALRSEHRTIVLPNVIRLDTVAPKVEGFGVTRRTIHVGERTRISYRFNANAHPIVLVDGRIAVYGRFAHASGTVDWFGRIAFANVRPGYHRLRLEGRDDAGNVSVASAPIGVRVRRATSAQARHGKRHRRRG